MVLIIKSPLQRIAFTVKPNSHWPTFLKTTKIQYSFVIENHHIPKMIMSTLAIVANGAICFLSKQ